MVESRPMNGGDGVYSYSNNSQFQRGVQEFTKEMVKDAIMDNLAAISSPLHIADFGCSAGPNTFFAMQNVIEAVQHKWSSQSIEFQVFFNDQTVNDFNTLFASLPSDRQYYAAAAPGSFYRRIFPRASINVAHSCLALQWLSQVPKSVSDSKSPAWNEGRLHCSQEGSPKATVDAYAEQFEKDMGDFLTARAEEIVPGGMMVLILPAEDETGSPSPFRMMDFLGNTLLEMASEGIIKKAQIDAFNFPLYFPTIGEMKKVIEKNGCFNIERTEITNYQFGVDESRNGHMWTMHFRASLEGIFSQHFGSEVAQEMLDRGVSRREEASKMLSGAPQQLFVALKRK